MDTSLNLPGVNPPHRPARTEVTEEQLRYVQLKLTTKLNNRQLAKQMGVHYNTIANWNDSPLVKQAINVQVEALRKDNLIGMQRLMASLVREASNVLDDEEVGVTLKIQLIGQLFSQAGRFAGLEPVKQAEKKVTVVKSFEQMVDCEALDAEEVD